MKTKKTISQESSLWLSRGTLLIFLIISCCKFFPGSETQTAKSAFQSYRNERVNRKVFLNKNGFNWKTESGIQLSFPPNVFDCEEEDSVTLEVSEFTTLSQMVMAGLNTMSGEKLLETNGMIYCKALNAAANEIKIKTGKEFKITFPNGSKSAAKEFMLFEGKEKNGVVDWVNPKPGINAKELMGKSKKKNHKTENQTTMKQEQMKTEKSALVMGAYGIQNELDFTDDVFKFRDTTQPFLLDYFFNNYTMPINKDIFPLSPDASFLLFFDLLPNGSLNFRGCNEDLNPALVKSLSSFFLRLPQMKSSGSNNGPAVTIPIFFNILPNKSLAKLLEKSTANQSKLAAKKENLERIVEEEAREREVEKKKIEKQEKKQNEEFEIKEAERIAKLSETERKRLKFDKATISLTLTFNSSSLGWINCDRFQNSWSETSIIAFKNIEEYQDYNLQLVLPNINSIYKVIGSKSLEIAKGQKVVVLFYSLNDDSLKFYSFETTMGRKDQEISIYPKSIERADLQKKIEYTLAGGN